MYGEPCGKCSQCLRIASGKHADIRIYSLESLDQMFPRAKGSSTRKQIPIEAIQTLRREAYLKPFEGRTRVFVIDGAEVMSQEASNALLKTLEEPPMQVMIILIASSTGPLPSTIISRCMVINLWSAPLSLIKRGLMEIHGADEATAERFAKLSLGRPGWAVAALNDPALMEKNVQSAIRAQEMALGDTEHRFRMAADLATQWRHSPSEVKQELDRWMWWWRDLAMIKTGLKNAIVNMETLDELERLAENVDVAQVTIAINAILKARGGLDANVGAQLSVELLALSLPKLSA